MKRKTARQSEIIGATQFGRIEGEKPCSDGESRIRRVVINWIPNRRKLRGIPKGFVLPLQIFSLSGERFVRPVQPLFASIEQAAIGGLALLTATRKLDAPKRQSYRLMSLIFHWSRSGRRLHTRQIKRLEDLELTRTEKGAVGRDTVIPEDLLGLHHSRPMTPNELVDLGREFAKELGYNANGVADLIDFGLLSVALDSPSTATMSSAPADGCVKYALFGIDAASPLSDSANGEVIEDRIIKLFNKHLDDQPNRFAAWMKDVSTIVRTIAKQSRPEPLNPEDVRSALFDLLWRAHQYTSQCVAAQMMAIAHCFEPKLSYAEQRDFRLWYRRTPWLGGLVPVVLHGHINLVAKALTIMHDRPDGGDRPWQAFLQALLWKNQMVEARRLADRAKKVRKGEVHLDDRFWDNATIDGPQKWPKRRR